MARKTMSQLTSGISPITRPKKIDNNTIMYTDQDNWLCYRLHNTDVVKRKGNTVIINTGGWDTLTTRDRINKYAAPVRVWRERGVTYAGDGKSAPIELDRTATFEV
jgi:hypothetical protein